MMRAPHIIILIGCITASLIIASCGGGGDVATPRRNAYPRINVPDTVYVAAQGTPLHFEVNAAALIAPDTATVNGRDPNSQWFNIVYPSLGGSVVYTTFTSVSNKTSLDKVLDNRVERMSLNSGGNPSELTEFATPAGFSAKVLVTPQGSITPVQFLAYDQGHVLSGSYVISSDDALRPDSIRPVIDAVARDIIHALKQLK